jgi:putative endonuclease
MKNTTSIGIEAESKACDYLQNKGYKIIERNYRNRFSEIDIVCLDSEYICLVEVKYRKNSSYGGGAGAINRDKQGRLRRAFEYWLMENENYSNLQPRIDIVSVDSLDNIEHIENAIENS